MNPYLNVKPLLDMLRDAKLSWLAEEIILAIEEQRHLSDRTFDQQQKDQKPFLFDEPRAGLAQAIQIIRDLFVAAPLMHDEAVGSFSEEGGLLHKPVKIVAIDPTNAESSQLIGFEAIEAAHRLDRLLREAWPYGPEDYQKTFFHEH